VRGVCVGLCKQGVREGRGGEEADEGIAEHDG